MSGYSTPEVQRAALALLKAHAGLAAIVGTRIFDTAPADAVFPCVAINQIDVEAYDSDGTDGATITLAMSAFTVGVGARVEAQAVTAQIVDALTGKSAAMTTPGHKVWQCRFMSSVVFRTEDQRGGAHGLVRFRINTTSNTAPAGA